MFCSSPMFLQEGGGLRKTPPPLFCNANSVIVIIIAILMIGICIVILEIVTLQASARGRSTPEAIFSENVATLHVRV